VNFQEVGEANVIVAKLMMNPMDVVKYSTGKWGQPGGVLSVGAGIEMERRANEFDNAKQSDDSCFSRDNGLSVLMGLHGGSPEGSV
jgi:hypothetical protein